MSLAPLGENIAKAMPFSFLLSKCVNCFLALNAKTGVAFPKTQNLCKVAL